MCKLIAAMLQYLTNWLLYTMVKMNKSAHFKYNKQSTNSKGEQ